MSFAFTFKKKCHKRRPSFWGLGFNVIAGMYEIIKILEFSYGHRLLDHPKCQNLHGHNGKAEIVLFADSLDQNGMVSDFSQVRTVVGGWINSHLDHQMLLSQNDPLLKVCRDYQMPVYVFDSPPTAEAIAKTLFDITKQNGFSVKEVRFWETSSSVGIYRGEPSSCPPA